MPKSWLDVGVHVLIASVGVAVLTLMGLPIFALFANSVGWPVREGLQSRTFPWRWSAQKHWEAWAPVLVGWLVIAEVMARG